jgi:hypothetical protein
MILGQLSEKFRPAQQNKARAEIGAGFEKLDR